MLKNGKIRWLALFVGAGALSFGCLDFGGLESGAPDGGDDAKDASSDANAGEASTGDASFGALDAGCLVAPTVKPIDSAFCSAFAAAGNACGQCAACTQSDVNDCAAIADATSTIFHDAFLACRDSGTDCTGYPFTNEATACELQKISMADLDSAQTGLENAYCSHCADAGVDGIPCSNFYFNPDGGSTAATGLLFASDNILNMVSMNCASVCGSTFFVCAAQQFCSAAPQSACATGLCK